MVKSSSVIKRLQTMIRERALVYFKGLIIAWKGHCPWFV